MLVFFFLSIQILITHKKYKMFQLYDFVYNQNLRPSLK